jgi:hypothetical protein
MWLQEEDIPDFMRPDKSHVILWVTEDGKTLLVSVDPEYPEAYRQGDMANLLGCMLELPNAQVGVMIGEERFPLTPDFLFEGQVTFDFMEGI